MSECALESNDSIIKTVLQEAEEVIRNPLSRRSLRKLTKQVVQQTVVLGNVVMLADYCEYIAEDDGVHLELVESDDTEKDVSLIERQDAVMSMVGKFKSSIYVQQAIEKHRSKRENSYTSDTLTQLMNTAGLYKRLSDEKTVEYYNAIDQGVSQYYEGVDFNNKPQKQIMLDMVAAHQILMLTNLGLVISIAMSKQDTGLMSKPDLIQEGNIGLSKGICRFDISKGYKPSTYIVPWINQAINRSIVDHSRLIRVPVYRHEIFQKIPAKTEELTGILGHEPSVKEIAEYTNLSESDIEEYRLNGNYWLTSLSEPTNHDIDVEISELIADSDSIDQDKIVYDLAVKQEFTEIIEKGDLDDRTKIILGLRYGGLDYQESNGLQAIKTDGTMLSYYDVLDLTKMRDIVTFSEIGILFGFSDVYARQLANKGFQKLKNIPESETIGDIL